MGVLLITFILAILLYYILKVINKIKCLKMISKVPGPKGNWLLGNSRMLINNNPEAFFDFFRNCAATYKNIYRLSLPLNTSVNLLNPEDFEIVLSQTKHMQKSKVYNFMRGWLGGGLLLSTGSKWQTRRKILTRAFHFNILQQFLGVFIDGTDGLIDEIEKINKISGKPEFVHIPPLITNLTLQAMCETSMGMKDINEDMALKYKQSVHKIGKLLFTRIASPLLRIDLIYNFTKIAGEEKQTVKTLHDFTNRIIKEREKEILNKSHVELISTSYSGKKMIRMLDLLLLAKINEKTIHYEGIREEVDTFMFEGHDTTAAALNYILYSLASHPQIQEEVRQEINYILGDKEHPTYNDIQDLSYTERVIKESLRLFPSVPLISRISSEDLTTSTGYYLPKGTIIHLHIYDLHRNPNIYPDPLKFDPDRFLPENCSQRHPFAYVPFSAGPRNCIGQKFAMMELKTVICGIVRKYKLENGTTELKFIPDLVLRTDSEIKVKFLPIDRKH